MLTTINRIDCYQPCNGALTWMRLPWSKVLSRAGAHPLSPAAESPREPDRARVSARPFSLPCSALALLVGAAVPPRRRARAGAEPDGHLQHQRVGREPVHTVLEGSTVQVAVRLSAPHDETSPHMCIPITVTRNSAEAGDYTVERTFTGCSLFSGTRVWINEWFATVGWFNIQTNHDADEDDETFTVSMGTGSGLHQGHADLGADYDPGRRAPPGSGGSGSDCRGDRLVGHADGQGWNNRRQWGRRCRRGRL